MEHLNTAGGAGETAGREKEFNLYIDIRFRTDGEIYLGVVGPVRTGKSTFIKRFMDLLVLPYMENEHEKQILTYRYLLGWSWEKISEEMGYTIRHITRMHGSALKNFKIL